ncbi:MAG: LysR family transcriptional regulator [Pseudomonadota bacterium]
MFKISLDALLVLDAIERLGSFAAAGNELFKVPSTISYTVSKLESDLDVQIYERQGPKIALTKAGRELLNEGRHLMKAATDLEHRVRRVASGWETELNIGLDSLFSPVLFIQEIAEFYKVAAQTRLRFIQESLSGTWEALIDRRVDLLLAAGEGPSGGGYHTHKLGSMQFIFAVAPFHPLAAFNKVLDKNDLYAYKAIAVSDSVRKMPARTVGLLAGQDTLMVPTMRIKLELQKAGLGFGFLPEPLARPAIKAGELIVKEVAETRADEPLYLAWRTGESGSGLKWWIEHVKKESVVEKLWL